ncbi:hypothetical protein ACN47E_008542 [Coniothyrium glycines]
MNTGSDTSSKGKAKNTKYRDIKKYDYFFGSGQTWVKSPRNVNFINETRQVAENVENSGIVAPSSSRRKESKTTNRPIAAERPRYSTAKTGHRSVDYHVPLVDKDYTKEAGEKALTSAKAGDPWQLLSQSHLHAASRPESVSSLKDGGYLAWNDSYSDSGLDSTGSANSMAWPLSNSIDARLFQFWVGTAAAWFDALSPHSIFSNKVPVMALQNPMLLNAVLLTSAQHIHRFEPDFPATPFMYHQRLLHSLIPYLAERGRIDDEATLVAAMLLRCFEEHYAGSQTEDRLSPIELLQGPSGWHFDMSKPVIQACLMMHVHNEICHALLHQREMRVNYEESIIPVSMSTSGEITWRNRIVWYCARILQWSKRENRTMTQWRTLTALVDDWNDQRPATYDALSLHDVQDDVLAFPPELQFKKHCHVSAFQHMQLCRMALMMFRPPPGRHDAYVAESPWTVQNEISRRLKDMIIAARCNTFAMCAGVAAAYAIHSFAIVLEDELDRSMMMEFLAEVNTLGWSTAATVVWLRWHWYEDAQDSRVSQLEAMDIDSS